MGRTGTWAKFATHGMQAGGKQEHRLGLLHMAGSAQENGLSLLHMARLPARKTGAGLADPLDIGSVSAVLACHNSFQFL